MNWVDLTDMLFCRAYGHLFTIKKPEYRNDIVVWRCIDSDDNVIAEGKTVLVSTAKNLCKDVYKQVRSADQSIYVKSSGRLCKVALC